MVTVLEGDASAVLETLPEASVQCVVTSPPYWGLRDYGTASWDGGDAACDHAKLMGGTGAQNLGKSAAASAANVERSSVAYRDTCGKCGATRIDRQIGLEATPEAYLERMVGVFRAVRRVLRGDGVCWVNMGDGYATGTTADRNPTSLAGSDVPASWSHRSQPVRNGTPPGLKPKDLVGMPWRLAFALQADGWFLRADIIWAKPNPMPESVTDRPTKSHEYVFLLTKSARYFYDAEAVREPGEGYGRSERFRGANWTNNRAFANGQDRIREGGGANSFDGTGRNLRSVWTIPTEPTPDAHFATFPQKLVTPCILAGSRVRDTVLDPFAGTGTVGRVAEDLGRDSVLIELNPAYAALARQKTAQRGLFASPAMLEATPERA